MFTGIIESVGRIESIKEKYPGKQIEVSSDNKKMIHSLKEGDSIAVNGACQTVEKRKKKQFSIFCLPDTLQITNFQNFRRGSIVNLETSLTLQKKISGHIVQGHVEGTGEINKIESNHDIYNIFVQYYCPYIMLKSSICIDGISLTIQEILENNIFRVQIIPETIKRTNISHWHVGYKANIETDYLAKIVYEKKI